jgi:hypothetical protein
MARDMKDYDQQIARLKIQVLEATTQLAELENEKQTYLEQLDLLETRQGRIGSMASIKRWADNGYLGDVIDEREAFPLLEGKQGNKRYLYPRDVVLRFLHDKGLLSPAYEVLDRVQLMTAAGAAWALVTAIERDDHRFTYQVQLESSGDVLSSVAEEFLSRP